MSGQEVLDELVGRLSGECPSVAIIGMGYVGLPLAIELGETGARVIGLDVSDSLAAQLNEGHSHMCDIRTQILEDHCNCMPNQEG